MRVPTSIDETRRSSPAVKAESVGNREFGDGSSHRWCKADASRDCSDGKAEDG